MATDESKAATRKRKATYQSKAATRMRLATDKFKAATRMRMAAPSSQLANSQRKAARTQEQHKERQGSVCYARAHRQAETLATEGTWVRSAQKAFESQALPACQMLPPSYIALHNPRCLDFVRDMYDALDAVQWQTCVVCWRAWFAVPTGYRFQPPAGTRNKKVPSWFNFQDSTVLRASRRKEVDRWHMTAATPGSASDANLFLERNYDPASIKEIKERLQEPTQKRVTIICTSCNPHVEDGVLRPPPERVRLCDYVVDPVFSAVSGQALPVVRER